MDSFAKFEAVLSRASAAAPTAQTVTAALRMLCGPESSAKGALFIASLPHSQREAVDRALPLAAFSLPTFCSLMNSPYVLERIHSFAQRLPQSFAEMAAEAPPSERSDVSALVASIPDRTARAVGADPDTAAKFPLLFRPMCGVISDLRSAVWGVLIRVFSIGTLRRNWRRRCIWTASH